VIELFAARHRIPVILQSERAECGLACIAMVAGYFGYLTDLNALRRSFPTSARGANLKDLMATATSLQLNSRPLKLELEDLHSLQLPAILHWDMNHFVVLSRIRRNKLEILDPAVGRRCYSQQEISPHFTGIAIEITPGVEFEAVRAMPRSKLTDLFRRYPGFNLAVAQLIVLSFMLQLVAVGGAFYLQLVIDEAVAKQDSDILQILALAFLLLAVAGVAMTFARGQVLLFFANQLSFQMAGNVMTHLLSLPVSYFEKRHVGDLVSRFGSLREIRRILTEDLITVVLDGLFALLTLAVMFYFSAQLAGVVLLFVLLAAVLKAVFIPRLQILQEQILIAEASTSSNLMENMRAIEIIKFYCRELIRQSVWRNQFARQINSQVQLSRFVINIDAVYGMLAAAENILVVYLAARLVISGELTLGLLTAFVALKGNFTVSIRSFIDKLVQIRLVRLQLERVSDITCSEKEVDKLLLPQIRIPVTGRVTLERVSYTYPGSDTPVIDQVSLDLQPGELVVIHGASGSGKSTLLKIAAGLLMPDTGTVRIDGMDIRQYGIRQYRDLCAGVLQSDQLLSGSILDNISMFDEQIDHQRLREAASRAGILDFIESLPMGFNSLVGDMGSIMSAGQRQRLLLARTFYKQAKFWILDEATANLDPDLEHMVLARLYEQRITSLLVTHRAVPDNFVSRRYMMSAGRLHMVEPVRLAPQP
jgi:ATP-binding cassette subfamily B protein RaxB